MKDDALAGALGVVIKPGLGDSLEHVPAYAGEVHAAPVDGPEVIRRLVEQDAIVLCAAVPHSLLLGTFHNLQDG